MHPAIMYNSVDGLRLHRERRVGQGRKLSDEQIEAARLAYAETGVKADAARAAGCAPSAILPYLNQPNDNLDDLRTQKIADVVEMVAAVRLQILAEMAKPEKLRDARFQELATSFGILTDKHQILTGGATSRVAFDPSRLTPEQMEQAAAIRRAADPGFQA